MTDTDTTPNAFGIGIVPAYIGERRDRNGWLHNLWHITLAKGDRTITTEYRMGTALVDPPKRKSSYPRRSDEFPTPSTPTVIEVLHSLQLDAQVDEFDEYDDILGELRYSEARDMAAAIKQSADKVRYLLGADYQAFLETEYDR